MRVYKTPQTYGVRAEAQRGALQSLQDRLVLAGFYHLCFLSYSYPYFQLTVISKYSVKVSFIIVNYFYFFIFKSLLIILFCLKQGHNVQLRLALNSSLPLLLSSRCQNDRYAPPGPANKFILHPAFSM